MSRLKDKWNQFTNSDTFVYLIVTMALATSFCSFKLIDCQLNILFTILLIFVVLGFFWIRNKKTKFLEVFNSVFQGNYLSVVGAVLTFFVVIYIGVLQNLFLELLKDYKGYLLIRTLIQLMLLILPFLIIGSIRHRDKIGDPTILITSSGLIFLNKVDLKSKEKIKEFRDIKNKEPFTKFDYHYDDKENIITSSGNWTIFNPIRLLLRKYPTIKTVILLQSKEVNENDDLISKLIESTTDKEHIKYLKEFSIYHTLKDIKGHSVTKQTINPYYFEKTVEEIRTVVKELISRGRSDYEMVFGITSGTAVLTAALMLNAIKGERKAAYITQDTGVTDDDKKIIDIDLNVFTLDELIGELFSEFNKLRKKEI